MVRRIPNLQMCNAVVALKQRLVSSNICTNFRFKNRLDTEIFALNSFFYPKFWGINVFRSGSCDQRIPSKNSP